MPVHATDGSEDVNVPERFHHAHDVSRLSINFNHAGNDRIEVTDDAPVDRAIVGWASTDPEAPTQTYEHEVNGMIGDYPDGIVPFPNEGEGGKFEDASRFMTSGQSQLVNTADGAAHSHAAGLEGWLPEDLRIAWPKGSTLTVVSEEFRGASLNQDVIIYYVEAEVEEHRPHVEMA